MLRSTQQQMPCASERLPGSAGSVVLILFDMNRWVGVAALSGQLRSVCQQCPMGLYTAVEGVVPVVSCNHNVTQL